MKLTLDYFKADPAGNITGFVLGDFRPEERGPIARAIMQQVDEHVEQVGFIACDGEGHPLRMDMMGGEFCGNATRSFGLYAAPFMGVDEGEVIVHVSGSDVPLSVSVNRAEGTASVAMPPARGILRVELGGHEYPVVDLRGIVHLVAEEAEQDEAYVRGLIKELAAQVESEAYGVLFLNEGGGEMIPYVYVVGSDTLVREGSCASGSCAVAHYLNGRTGEDNGFSVRLRQPGGEMEVQAMRNGEGMMVYSIGGYVALGAVQQVVVNLEKVL